MAEAFLRELTGDELAIASAGAEAGRLDPHAAAAMREVGIDISSAPTKVIDPYPRERFHYVITLAIGIPARDAIHRHVIEFVEKHHHQTKKGKSAWN
jgi:protein-tyrosine-phosphatase